MLHVACVGGDGDRSDADGRGRDGNDSRMSKYGAECEAG